MRYYLVAQSLHQLRGKYGEDADTIKGNCDNWVFLTSKEFTAKGYTDRDLDNQMDYNRLTHYNSESNNYQLKYILLILLF